MSKTKNIVIDVLNNKRMNHPTTQALPTLQEAFALLEINSIGDYGCETIHEELYESLCDYILGTFFSFCLCSFPEKIMEIVGDFLNSYQEYELLRPDDWRSSEQKAYYEKRQEWFNSNESLHLFLLYYLNSVKFMEHGSNVCSSRITDKGKAFLVVYKWHQAQSNELSGQSLKKN